MAESAGLDTEPAATRRALLSVSRKDERLVEFGRGLRARGFEIVASGGTAQYLTKAGVAVREVSKVTGSPEILGGRVKTLHPTIHGGILARRNRREDLDSLERLKIPLVEVVAVNFYPFEETVKRGADDDEVRENIDIGGPSLVRAAAKNWPAVTVAVDPEDYPAVLRTLDEADRDDGAVREKARKQRHRLAAKALTRTAAYDAAISARFLADVAAEDAPVENGTAENSLGEDSPAGDTAAEDSAGAEAEPGKETEFPERLSLTFERVRDLRYGENPHQSAALYRDLGAEPEGILNARKLHGKALSYNNILDLDAALRITADLATVHPNPNRVAAVIIKHSNPAGAAVEEDLVKAYIAARDADRVSAFGGIVGLSKEVDEDTAKELAKTFLEAVVAPGFSEEALVRLRHKKNLRLVVCEEASGFHPHGRHFPRGRHFTRVAGGLLFQDWDRAPRKDWGGTSPDEEERFEVVTERPPNEEETEGLRFAWRVARQVRSNAIVTARRRRLLGVGTGQMNRLESCRLAVKKRRRKEFAGAVAASDAFFPFADGLVTLAKAGVRAVIQPGGSLRDKEVIAAANDHDLAMVFTRHRHFHH